MIFCSTSFLLVVFFKVFLHDKCEGTENELLFHKVLKDRRLENNLLERMTIFSVVECCLKCSQHQCCMSVNYAEGLNDIQGNCELNNAKASTHSDDLAGNDSYNYYEIVETKNVCNWVEKNFYSSSNGCEKDECKMSTECECPSGYGGAHCSKALGSGEAPGRNCKEIKEHVNNAISGKYWIKPITNGAAFLVHCDMKEEGGGWTLVYHYTFTNYTNFYDIKNAVTPRPNWPASKADVSMSTEPPTEEKFGAISFNLWKEIGKDFFIRSNINDWYTCTPEKGSLVDATNGSISCNHVKDIAGNSNCTTATPTKLAWQPGGPVLKSHLTIYRFDGRMDNHGYPTHNSCEEGTQNHKTGVENPKGEIFVR